MNKTVSILAIAMLESMLWESVSCGSTSWRLGGSLALPTSDSVRDRIGNGWGIVGEYSFTHHQPLDERWRGDLSFGVNYKRFDHDTALAANSVDWTTFTLRWRGGAGANPDTQGMYAGLGIGVAILRIQPAFDGSSEHLSATKFEYSAFGGVNVGAWAYLELGYYAIPDIQGVPLRNVAFTVGIRL